MSFTGPAGQSADIVIVGAGGAGLAAAAAAREVAPCDVLLLEKAADVGGNTAQSAGMFAVNSPAQVRKGIQVSAEEVFREKMAHANWKVDPALVRACIEKSGQIVSWLESKGMQFDNVIEFLREGEAPKVFHSLSPGPPGFIGRKVVDTLTAESAAQGIRILTETAAAGLLRDDWGSVVGVTARSGSRETAIRSKAVVVATGGFGANRAMLEKYFPGHGDVFTLCYPAMTGDGHEAAEEVGAAIDDNMALVLTGPHHYPWSHALSLLVKRPDILLVNRNGERYSDETLFRDYHTEAGNALSRQPGMICYCLLDSGLEDRLIAGGEVVSGFEREAGANGAWLQKLDAELEAGVARGTVLKASSWESVAGQIGVDARVLCETVARYNALCDGGHDGDFYKEPRFLQPLRTPPYYAVLGRQGFDTTLGGIKVDHRMQVISRQGEPIPGLYAAGDCASGWEHAEYNLRHPGSAMTFALCSGFIAGQEAAGYVRKRRRDEPGAAG